MEMTKPLNINSKKNNKIINNN